MRQGKWGKQIRNLVMSAMLMAVGMVLPFFTGQIPQIGSMLLPLHIPVLICGLICGWKHGGIVGFILPLFRSAVFGMPSMPNAAAMAFELAAYGAVAGFLYEHSRWKCIVSLYRSLIIAMVCGRLVWGFVCVLITGVTGEPFTWRMFFAGALINSVPGIILQLVFIPSFMLILHRTGLVHFHRKRNEMTHIAGAAAKTKR